MGLLFGRLVEKPLRACLAVHVLGAMHDPDPGRFNLREISHRGPIDESDVLQSEDDVTVGLTAPVAEPHVQGPFRQFRSNTIASARTERWICRSFVGSRTRWGEQGEGQP